MKHHVPIAHRSHTLNHIQQHSVQTPVMHRSVQCKGTTLCSHCGYALPHKNNVCLAQNKPCHSCGQPGHFPQVCCSHKMPLQPSWTHMTPFRSPISVIHEQANPSSEDTYLFILTSDKQSPAPFSKFPSIMPAHM